MRGIRLFCRACVGDGDPAGVNRRAAEDMKNAARAAQQFGVSVVNGFTARAFGICSIRFRRCLIR